MTIVVVAVLLLSLSCSCGSEFWYGLHYPNGIASVDYSYEIFWKKMCKIYYIWNYYQQYETKNHPYDPQALINYANGENNSTCRGANGHLLLDFNHDGEIDTNCSGYAFHEHDGIGQYGEKKGTPFTNFWYDDNYLARYASQAYSRELPEGLSEYDEFTRWRIVGGDNSYWTPYGGDYFDQLALDGMYYITTGDYDTAIKKFNRIITKSGSKWNKDNQEWDYPLINSNYYFGLILNLASHLRDYSTDYTYLDHYISIRSHILSNQQRTKDGSDILSWLTDVFNMDSLMNIETSACNVLGLGSRRSEVFEAGAGPLMPNASSNVFMRSYNVLSAVVGLTSSPSNILEGPSQELNCNIGNSASEDDSCTLEFILRVHEPEKDQIIASIGAMDSQSKKVLVSNDLKGDLFENDRWKAVSVQFDPGQGEKVDFFLVFKGVSNIDVSIVSVI